MHPQAPLARSAGDDTLRDRPGLVPDELDTLEAPVDERAVPDAARLTRVRLAFVAASVSTFVALVSHMLGGGAMPGLLGVLFPLGVAMLACLWLARIRTSAVRLALSVSVSQLLFHALFVLGSPPAAGSPSGHGAHHHGTAGATAALADLASAGTAPSLHLWHDGPGMWAMHAVAALLTCLALFFGERVLRALSTAKDAVVELLELPALRALHLLFLRAFPARTPRADAPRLMPWVPALSVRAGRALPRRGPPVGGDSLFPAATV